MGLSISANIKNRCLSPSFSRKAALRLSVPLLEEKSTPSIFAEKLALPSAVLPAVVLFVAALSVPVLPAETSEQPAKGRARKRESHIIFCIVSNFNDDAYAGMDTCCLG